LPESSKELKAGGAKPLYWAISLALAGVLLYFSLRGIEWGRVWQILGSAQLGEIGLCCLLVTLALYLRAVRWRILLRAEGRISIPAAFWATSAGYFGNNFLPARAGELVRTMMVSERAKLSRMYVLTTALSERMVDAIALVVISSCVLLLIPSKPQWLGHAAKPFAVLGFGGVLAIIVLPLLAPVWDRLLRKMPLPHGIKERLGHLVHQVLLGIRAFHHPGRLFGFLGLTLVVWLLDTVTTVIGAQSLRLDISMPIAFLLITGLGLGSALPSTPGYVGVYQFVAVSVLTPFGFRKDDSIAFILLFQAIQYVVITAWGLMAFWQARGARTAGLATDEGG